MNASRPRTLAAALALAATLGVSACGASTSTSNDGAGTTAASSASAVPGAPPGGAGGGSTTKTTPMGTFTHASGTASTTGKAYAASAGNTSGVLVTGGSLTLADATVTTTGASSSSDESSFYGLDAGVLATAGSLTMTGGTVTTSGNGANGVFAYGTSTKVSLTGSIIKDTGQYAHGIMASGGGTITATDVTAATTGANSAVIATDRGGGTITVSSGTYTTAGADSPVLYSTGTVSATGITGTATGAEMGAIEGSNSITLTDSTLTGTKKSGFMLMQSMSGDAQGVDAKVTITGGSISQAAGPLFFVTNSSGTITLSGVKVASASGVLLKAAADRWGTAGSNGGNAVLTTTHQTLTGDIVVDAISSARVSLTNGSRWTGAFDAANTGKTTALTLDSTSTWTVTKDSYVGALAGLNITGSTVMNIVGAGHTVHYDSASNAALGGKTYTLVGGGTLTPA